MRFLDILYIFLCFNVAIWFVTAVTGGFGFIAMDFSGALGKLVGIVTVASILGAVVAAWLTGADPNKIIVVGLFVTVLATLFTTTTVILGSLAAWLDVGAEFPLATAFLAIFLLVEVLISVIGVSQVATGGFKGHE